MSDVAEHDHEQAVAMFGECPTCVLSSQAARRGGGKVANVHPTSSLDAARRVRAGSQQALLLAIVAAAGDRGVNCAEAQPLLVAAAGHEISRNQTSTRMGELRDRDLVERRQIGSRDGRPVFESRATDGENEGALHWLTDSGRAALS